MLLNMDIGSWCRNRNGERKPFQGEGTYSTLFLVQICSHDLQTWGLETNSVVKVGSLGSNFCHKMMIFGTEILQQFEAFWQRGKILASVGKACHVGYKIFDFQFLEWNATFTGKELQGTELCFLGTELQERQEKGS